jgi:CubicO group peptidase (beta-lactamase class C family)
LRNRCSLVLALMTMAASQPLWAGQAVRNRQIEAIFANLQSNDAPGAAVLVLKNGHPLFQRGYGVTDLRTLRKIDSHTNFRLASFTKQFTAMAIMLLVHNGKLHYEDRLTDVFPDFPDYGRSITIRNLLNHTSGLQDYEDLMTPPAANTPPEKIPQIQDAEVLKLLEQQKTTKFAPGTKWAYSNSGYVVLGLVVAKASGQSFGQFLQERIFAPLQMKNTIAYEKGKNEVPHRAYGHTRVENAWRETDQSPTSATLGDGGVYSSLDDLARWDQALNRHTLLSVAEMRPALTPVLALEVLEEEKPGEPAQYGFGWFLDSYKGHARMWHTGSTRGFQTVIERFVDEKLTIVVLCNRTDLEPKGLALNVADLFFSAKSAP